MLRALEEFVIEGTATLLGFHRALLEHPCFVAGGTCHGVVESKELAQRAGELSQSFSHQTTTVAARSDGAATRSRLVAVEVDGRAYEINLVSTEPPWARLARGRRRRATALQGSGGGVVTSPMQGTVLEVLVAEGGEVKAGQIVCVVEAMKMENEIVAHADGVVRELAVSPGEPVAIGMVICRIAEG
jgi:acetyl-CoA/propionyl-CoA carboxylase biotin carboxyl carrier protein